ncbi:MAG: hypothetical protein M1133_00035 [Armatimonadetes bacterium]|nr:hypothetical protein [Armatimonadota bacterium]
MSNMFTILVNSTDSFEDCWIPFFTLFKAYWPDCRQPIVLNTETKDFSFPGLNITCSKVGKGYRGARPPWGWCLRQCLNMVESEVILYLQEDYFLEGPVDPSQIEEFAGCITDTNWSRQDCSHIGLTHYGSHSPFHLTENPLLWEIDKHAEYRLSLQAGLWKTRSMLKYLRDNDTGWNFEEVGSLRAQRINERLLTVNRHVFNPTARLIFPYTHTGIIRGRWNKDAVVDLFARHNLHTDFSIRGFHSCELPQIRRTFSRKVIDKVNRTFRNGIHELNSKIDQFRSI